MEEVTQTFIVTKEIINQYLPITLVEHQVGGLQEGGNISSISFKC
jgi:hypothetical protein